MSTVLPTIVAPAVDRTAYDEIGRPRPPLLRALGQAEPPDVVTVNSSEYRHVTTFKHDSWAASALYETTSGVRIVCKFNRTQPIAGLPTSWLGRALARRERAMLTALASEPFVPDACGDVTVAGRRMPTCVAHLYVAGRPLARGLPLRADFFPLLASLLARIHQRGIAYVDLHKRENILVGEDGRPHLIDFQISMRLPKHGLPGILLRMLQRCDVYHFTKHIRRARIDAGGSVGRATDADRPWTIRLHRQVAVPFRSARRRLLVWMRVRTAGGRAHTEAEPEIGALPPAGRRPAQSSGRLD